MLLRVDGFKNIELCFPFPDFLDVASYFSFFVMAYTHFCLVQVTYTVENLHRNRDIYSRFGVDQLRCIVNLLNFIINLRDQFRLITMVDVVLNGRSRQVHHQEWCRRAVV